MDKHTAELGFAEGEYSFKRFENDKVEIRKGHIKVKLTPEMTSALRTLLDNPM